jgi:hypothetical protein
MMKLPNGEELMHGKAVYDPIKAHAYYLRTRKLKGRQPAAVKETGGPQKLKTSFTVDTPAGKTEILTTQQLAKQKAYAATRVTAIQKRLATLNAALKAKIAAEAASAQPKHQTAAQKAKAAAESKKSKAKHQTANKQKAKAAAQKTAATSTTKKTTTVASLQKQITTTKTNLLNEVAKQRALAAAKKVG